MAKCSSNLFIQQPQTLQNICYQKIRSNFSLEKELYHYNFYGHLGYIYTFEKTVKLIRQIANNRYLVKQKSFEKWFRRFVSEQMDLLTENREDPKKMQTIAQNLVYRICKFRKVFGVAEEVLNRAKFLAFVLGEY